MAKRFDDIKPLHSASRGPRRIVKKTPPPREQQEPTPNEVPEVVASDTAKPKERPSLFSHPKKEFPSHRQINIPISSVPIGPRSHSGGWKKRFFWSSLIVIAALAVGVFLFNSFASATITITPRQETISISGDFVAKKGVPAADLPFEIMSVPGEESMDIPADEERTVDEKASGIIIVYNDYSAAPQRLVKNTRFETPDGKIYRLKDSIVVPGQAKEGGKTVPGSVEALVLADQGGETYNIGLSDFTIPGFKGDPRYEKFYARSKGEMTGGFSGVKRFPTDSALKAAVGLLTTSIGDRLTKNAEAQKPAGYTFYPSSSVITIADDPNVSVSGKIATVTVKGSLSAPIFPTDTLSQLIARRSLASFDGSPIDIPDLSDISITFSEAKPDLSGDSIALSLSGQAHVVWRVDSAELSARVAGKPRSEFNTILAGLQNVRRAEAALMPFWLSVFPEDVNRITIRINTTE